MTVPAADSSTTVAASANVANIAPSVPTHTPVTAVAGNISVGQSVFYDCIDLSPMAEKQDTMKPERSASCEDTDDTEESE